MSLIKSIKSLGGTSFSKYPLDPANYRGLMGEFFLPGGQGPVDRFIYTDYNSSLTAIENCPPLTAVILKKSAAYINGKTWVMDDKGQEAKSKFAQTLKARLLNPNPLQTWKQFEAQQQFIINAFGFSILLPIQPTGFKETVDCSSMWNIPPSMLDIQETGKLFYQTDLSGMLKSVVLNYKGEKTVLKSEDGNVNKPFFIFRDLLPGFCSMIFPDSRIKSLSLPISNIMGALESRGVLINYRGAMGILSSTNDKFGYVPIKPDTKKELQRDFMRYGLKHEQWKFIITSASLNWQQMSIPTKDLMLFEEIEDDVNMICDEMGYPIDLMAGSQRKTYQNAPQAWRSLYQDTIIPEADNTYDQWNMVFDCVANGCKMEKDYNHVPALQENKSEQATARKTMGEAVINEFKNNLITYNRVLELIGEDQLPGMDLYYREIVAQDPSFSPAPVAAVTDNLNNNQTG